MRTSCSPSTTTTAAFKTSSIRVTPVCLLAADDGCRKSDCEAPSASLSLDNVTGSDSVPPPPGAAAAVAPKCGVAAGSRGGHCCCRCCAVGAGWRGGCHDGADGCCEAAGAAAVALPLVAAGIPPGC